MAQSTTERIKGNIRANITIASFIVGGVCGLVIESNTDEVARGKILTVETCRDITGFEHTVTEQFVKCIEDGVPGGDPVMSDPVEVGDPEGLVDAYLSAQENEQGIEPARIIGWGVLGSVFSIADWFI